MYTGLQLSKDLDIRVRQTNAGAYFSPARKEYCLRMAIVSLLESNYKGMIKQKSVDEISPLIKTYTSFAPFNNQVLLKPLHITNIVFVSGTTYQVFFDRPHNFSFVSGTENITFRGVLGGTYTNLNGQTYGASDATTSIDTSVLITVGSVLTGTYTLTSGEVYGDYWIWDYYHLLAVSCVSLKDLRATIKNVRTAPSLELTIGTNNIRTGEYLRFSGFGGLTGINNQYKYVKKISERKIKLYDDVALTVPTVVVGTYTSGGKIERKHDRYCEPLTSDQKISYYQPTELFPLYESNENRLACYTSEQDVDPFITSINYFVDYITVQANIDITNNTIDLLQTYNQEMCRMIIEKAATYFFAFNTSAEDIQILPVTQ